MTVDHVLEAAYVLHDALCDLQQEAAGHEACRCADCSFVADGSLRRLLRAVSRGLKRLEDVADPDVIARHIDEVMENYRPTRPPQSPSA